MISILENYNSSEAAAVLARAAFSIEDESNPAANLKWPEEAGLRREILNQARIQLGISEDDQSELAIQKLSEFLDIEIDRLSKPENTELVLDALARRGDLPSDLYLVRVMESLKTLFGKHYDEEFDLINETVAAPDREQHFGVSEDRRQPHLVSLFIKSYPNTKYSFRSFKLLVVGQRVGRFFDVLQAWRIYPDAVSTDTAKDLVEVLKRFADVFGYPIKYNGKKTHFIYSLDIPRGSTFANEIQIEGRTDKNGNAKRTESTISLFAQPTLFGSNKSATLICSIDVLRYRKFLRLHGWGT
jgi:hypothetical protein